MIGLKEATKKPLLFYTNKAMKKLGILKNNVNFNLIYLASLYINIS